MVKQSSIFITASIFNLLDFVVLSHAVMAHYVCLAGCIKNGLSMLPEMAILFFSCNAIHVATRHLHQQQTLSIWNFV